LHERPSDLASVVDVVYTDDEMFGETVWVVVNELVESDLHAITARAHRFLAGREVDIKIRFEERNLLTIAYPNDFSAEELAHEVDYWLALSNANSAPLGILLQHGWEGRYRNIWDPDETDVVDWDALRAVPDSSTAERSYYLDEMVVLTSMPTPDVLAFREGLAAIELGDDETVSVDYSAPGYVFVRYFSPEAGRSDPTALGSWPRVREIVSEIAALGLPQSNFVFSTDDFATGASLHLGDCAQLSDENANWRSAELAAALASSGAGLPVGVSSGFCDDAHE
jgi:hypothetical protein